VVGQDEEDEDRQDKEVDAYHDEEEVVLLGL